MKKSRINLQEFKVSSQRLFFICSIVTIATTSIFAFITSGNLSTLQLGVITILLVIGSVGLFKLHTDKACAMCAFAGLTIAGCYRIYQYVTVSEGSHLVVWTPLFVILSYFMFEKRMARFSSAFASIPPFIILIHYENNDVIFWVKHIILGLLIWAFTDVIFRLIGKTIKELNYALTKSVDDSNSKSRLLQSLSHEIRTPLNGIVGAAEILNNQSDSEDSLNHILQKSSSRLTDTLNELVELSQLESLETHPDVVINVGKVTTAIVENYRQIAEKKDVYVALITDEALPSINWPRGYYETLLNHLLQNAVTYTKEGYIIVSVERIKKSGWFTLKVEDTGIGFSDSFRDIIFEPFSREAPDSGDSKGSGLGLAFVDKIVNIVNGELSLNSTKGVGSEFTLKLPEHAFSESEYR